MQLQDKAAIVTGGGTGVGRATSLALARLGCGVVVNYRTSREDAEATVAEIQAAGGRAIALQADVADDAQTQSLVDAATAQFGRLDVLVNNAGTTEFIAFEDLQRATDDVWQRIFATNVLGPFHCARAAAPAMRDSAGPDGGEIVNVSSVAGIVAAGSSIPYAASKAAVNNLTKSLARTLAPQIRVNAVAPGFTSGRWLQRGLGERYESVRDAFAERMPLGRVSDPADVAAAIVGLVTGSDQVTGQILICDGGQTLIDPVRL